MRIMISGMGRSIEPGEARGRANIATISASPFQQYASPGTQVDSGPPADYEGPTNRVGVGGSDRHLRWYMSIPAIVQKTVWAEENGYDAVIQSNNFEHGVEASRLAVRIPVLGLCRTTMHVAANFADRIGVTVPLDGYFVLARHLLESHNLQHCVSGLKSLGFDEVPPADQVEALRPAMYERTIEIMRDLIKEGAECIVPLGGAVIPSVLDPKVLTKEVGAPVFNPREVGIKMAELCVNLGITQSPLTYTKATVYPYES